MAIYYGIFLTNDSQTKLKERFVYELEDAEKIYCHHMTICFGEPKTKEIEEYIKENKGKLIKLTVFAYGESNKAKAVLVYGNNVKSENKKKHITLCTVNGGKPVESNNIEKFTEIEEFQIEGYLDEYPKREKMKIGEAREILNKNGYILLEDTDESIGMSLKDKIEAAKKFNDVGPALKNKDAVEDELEEYLEEYEYNLPQDDYSLDIAEIIRNKKDKVIKYLCGIKTKKQRERWLDEICYVIPDSYDSWSEIIKEIKYIINTL